MPLKSSLECQKPQSWTCRLEGYVCTSPSRPGHTLPRLQVGRIQAKSTSQCLVIADQSAQCTWDTCTNVLPCFSFVGQGISALLLAAAMAPLGFPSLLTLTFHFMKEAFTYARRNDPDWDFHRRISQSSETPAYPVFAEKLPQQQ